ncbi:SurA N-terminal domain-containing protein [Reinekea marinisedimentorum]|uniref:Periplasmic chaperone PpiD n=1 Tax=Reinekea marinisedimentorum TaxID=230495 RepID=A0A4R3I8I4_9GAMM|nr:SurA N-terminal domain-containing protein [Reinekea marinisedimentorum]TCS42582.1 peptidyl-prolyl cis-trans isomerase D [Reinekea marinisedimentorum]
MLQVFRNSAKGNVGKIIVGLIVVTFVLFGAESIVSIAGNSAPATVNGDKVSEIEYQRLLSSRQQELASQYGAEFAAQLANSSVLKEQVLNSLINQILQQQLTSKLEFQVSEEQVLESLAEITAFQVDGKFDKDIYESLLAANGYNHATFVAEQKAQTALTQMQAGVANSAFSVEKTAKRYASLMSQKRLVSYKEFTSSDFLEEAQATEQQIENYYQENQQEFISPEQVKVEFVRLTQSFLASQVEVTDAQVQSAYEAYVAELKGQETREVSHILFADGDDAEAEAQATLQRLNAGEAFGDLAAELSDDPGSAEFGGSLGELIEGVYVGEFYDAAIALAEEGDVSEPVKTEFGYHLIRLDTINKPTIDSIDQKRDQLIAQIKATTAAEELLFVQEELADLSFSSDSLTAVAENFGVVVEESDWLERNSGEGLLSDSDLAETIFSDQVLFDGLMSDVVRLSNDDLVVVKMIDYQAEAIKDLEEVSAEVAAIVQAENARELMEQFIAEQLSSESVDDSWAEAVSVARIDSDTLPANVLIKAFEMAAPAEGQVTKAQVVDGDVAYIVAVLEVENVEPPEDQIANAEAFSAQMAASEQYQMMFNIERNNAKIKIR